MPNANSSFTIRLNGEPHEVSADARLIALIDRLKLNRGRIAVEINHAIVPKARWAEVTLNPNDTVEIVNFVGGG